jgi:predicted O-linked N-acetylglucosamine transferase (SPINDLY family)
MMTVPQAFNLALQHHQAGRLAEAEAIYRQILAAHPHHSEALHMAGVIAHQTGRQELAIEWIQRAIALIPTNAAAYSNLGEAYRAAGRLADAASCYRRALQLKPDFAEAHSNLAVALWSAGQFDEAIEACREALAIRPDYPEALYNLGNALRDRGQSDGAIAAYHRALKLRPNYQKVFNNLGNALWDQGRVDEAVTSYRQALACGPDDAGIHSNLIMALHYLPGDASQTIVAEKERWDRHFGQPAENSALLSAVDRNAERRLRIGYVSPDLWDHVTGRNLLPLLRHHDHQAFEIITYAGVVQPDEVTAIFQHHSDQWINALQLADDALAERIRADQIDILVDLSLHGGGNRLPVFARKPAPLQISFAGYPAATGLKAIPYRISDRWLEANDKMQDASREFQDSSAPRSHPETCNLQPASSTFFIDSFWCYDPCGAETKVHDLPVKQNGHVTFGSLNTFRKINESVLRLWARILAEVPDSRLLLLSAEGSYRRRPLEILANAGVEEHRVEFVAQRPRRDYLELYHRLDLALDPFPYNGHTTSLDALWMGVPVVSLAGEAPVSRGGLSILRNLGLPELVARSEDDYVRIAAELARDRARLTDLRATLRDRMAHSVLMDAPRFAAQIERAYRTMWREWVTKSA